MFNIYMKYTLVLFLSLLSLQISAQETQNPEAVLVTPEQKTEFLRIHKGSNGVASALQLANARYIKNHDAANNVSVDLISAVHIADKSYYENLNELFKTYDVVLYELVAPEGTRVGGNVGDKSKGDKNTGGKNISLMTSLQRGMQNVLGLTFQLDEVDYSASNFVHADISPTDFKRSMAEKGESFLSMFLKLWLVGMQQQAANKSAATDAQLLLALFSPTRERDLKVIVAQQFIQMRPTIDALEGENGSTIITTRNLKALQVLRQEIKKGHKKLAIFYGAAHMPGIEEGLIEEFGMQLDQINWVDGWDLRVPVMAPKTAVENAP
ncbi:MAG: hypothetical protein L3J24_05955 [Xanthomonadales bacterium]|nr:hypothetical protein [Xanthomonadales bacterium]